MGLYVETIFLYHNWNKFSFSEAHGHFEGEKTCVYPQHENIGCTYKKQNSQNKIFQRRLTVYLFTKILYTSSITGRFSMEYRKWTGPPPVLTGDEMLGRATDSRRAFSHCSWRLRCFVRCKQPQTPQKMLFVHFLENLLHYRLLYFQVLSFCSFLSITCKLNHLWLFKD